MSKKEIIKVQVNSEALAASLKIKTGQTVDVECRRGVPLSAFWRNRLADAKLVDKKGKRIDNSIEVLNNTATSEKKSAPSADK